MKTIIRKEIAEHLKVARSMTNLTDKVQIVAQLCIDSLRDGGKILIFGNGGSAGDAQHIAAELVGRYKNERKGLSAIALTTDTSTITSISNDYSYQYVFERQVEALANKGDVLIGISTSGNSVNVINGLKIAPLIGCRTIGLSGSGGGEMNKVCEINLVVSSKDTARIQEIHITIGHIICHLIEQEYTD